MLNRKPSEGGLTRTHGNGSVGPGMFPPFGSYDGEKLEDEGWSVGPGMFPPFGSYDGEELEDEGWIMPKKPAEEGNDSKEVPEASAPQNHGKELCPPGNPTTSEKIHETSGNREAQEKEERRGTAHRWSSQNTYNIGPKRGEHAWTHRLRERKQVVIYEEISDPEEDDE
ncbi:uncharacterized protein LOC100607153 [Nomascus leucogenys]|uniref:uncharacterized protein LOC100607153 n=1 Tax=Nomascus leucogenys TaxID=61853 RepID=UPI00122DA89A|nr:uncharacterized protein LOC100607153 [Nomascus leucogenys]